MSLRKQPPKRKKVTGGNFLLGTENNRDTSDALDKVSDMVDNDTSNSAQRKGAVGTMRIVKVNSQYRLELKTEDGWIVSDSSSSTGFKFKKG